MDEKINLIMLTKHGSHLYGLNTEKSDTDYYAVYCPSELDFYTSRNLKIKSLTTGQQKSKNTKDDIDCILCPLHLFVHQLMGGAIKELDSIHATDDSTLFKTDVWNSIVKNRTTLYTNNLLSFAKKYINSQTAKYASKGSRLHTIKQMIELFDSTKNSNTRLKDIWDTIPEIDHVHKNEENSIKLLVICGKIYQETIKCNEASDRLKKMFDVYGQRAIDAEQNKNIDWKAVSHSVRTAFQIQNILNNGDFDFPFTGERKDLLMRIKQGKMNYCKELVPLFNFLYDDITKEENIFKLKEYDDALYIQTIHDLTKRALENKNLISISELIGGI